MTVRLNLLHGVMRPFSLCDSWLRIGNIVMVASQGLEPQQAESESAVLPLHHEAVRLLFEMAGSTGLEPATPGSTVQCANQLRHNPVSRKRGILYHIYPLQCKWKFHLSALLRQKCSVRGTFYHLLFPKSAAPHTSNGKNDARRIYLPPRRSQTRRTSLSVQACAHEPFWV